MFENEMMTAMVLLLEGEALKVFKEIQVQTSKGFINQFAPEEIKAVEIYVTKLIILIKADGSIKIYSDADLYFKI